MRVERARDAFVTATGGISAMNTAIERWTAGELKQLSELERYRYDALVAAGMYKLDAFSICRKSRLWVHD